jgi:hypothetical protein
MVRHQYVGSAVRQTLSSRLVKHKICSQIDQQLFDVVAPLLGVCVHVAGTPELVIENDRGHIGAVMLVGEPRLGDI